MRGWHAMGVIVVTLGATPALAQQTPAAEVKTGKEIFLQKCASCHDADGSKPLASGPPLAERKLAPQKLEASVKGRLKGRTPQEREAVLAYIRGFMKQR